MPYIQKMNMENRIGKIDILTYIMLVWLIVAVNNKKSTIPDRQHNVHEDDDQFRH